MNHLPGATYGPTTLLSDASQKVSLNAKQDRISTSDELLKQVQLRLTTGKEKITTKI